MRCDSKIKYKSRISAWKWSVYHLKMFGTQTGIYRCRFCGKYHLSRKSVFSLPKKLLNKI